MTEAHISKGEMDNLLSRLDQGAAYQGYPEGFGFSWTKLARDAATAIRALEVKPAPTIDDVPSCGQVAQALEALGIRWSRVNGECFEYAIQQGPHGDEFVKLLNGACLKRAVALPSSPAPELRTWIEGGCK